MTSVTGYVEGAASQITVAPIGEGKYLRSDAASAFIRMRDAARADGLTLTVASAFRTYDEQKRLHDAYLAGQGNLAAAPGYSNHQGGISLDISVGQSYTHPVYLWLAQNAGRFGFVNDVRGEPWHWTYKPSFLPRSPVFLAGMTTAAVAGVGFLVWALRRR